MGERTATAVLLLGALAALAATPKPAPRLKPGEVALTIYCPYSEDDEDFEDDLLAAASRLEGPHVRPPSSNAVLAAQARHLGLAVVRECRSAPLPAGVGECRFSDVSAMLDATTTRLLDLSDPDGTTVLEQNFLFDLVDAKALLKRFIDRPVEVADAKGRRHRGVLLSDGFPLLLRAKNGSVKAIQPGDRRYSDSAAEFFEFQRSSFRTYTLTFPESPANFVTRPTLAWRLKARRAGVHDVAVSYQTGGLAWRSDYSAVLSPDESHLDLSGWVTIANVCGTRFPNARVKLVAGDVHRANPPRLPRGGGGQMAQEFFGADEEQEPQFKEKAFFEYHLYTLQRTTTIENNQTKQIELLRAQGVPVTKVYTYDGAILQDVWCQGALWAGELREDERDETYGAQCRKTVRVNVEFENRKESNLGMPLPGGVVRLYKRDPADESPEFIGGDAIRHTPKDERVRLYLGNAFDVVGGRVRTDFELPAGNQVRESFEIELRNHKDSPVTVCILEYLYRGANWKIEKSSLPFKKLDDRSIEFAIPVPANGKATVTYTVLYWWPPESGGGREF